MAFPPVKGPKLLAILAEAAGADGMVSGLRYSDLGKAIKSSPNGISSILHKLISCGALRREKWAPGDGCIGTYFVTGRPYQAMPTQQRTCHRVRSVGPAKTSEPVEPEVPALDPAARERVASEFGFQVGPTFLREALTFTGKRLSSRSIPITLPVVPLADPEAGMRVSP